jgi:hypothetical protein
MLSVTYELIMLSVIMMNVVMMSVIMTSVVTPVSGHTCKYKSSFKRKSRTYFAAILVKNKQVL